jgi:acyl carrier protein
MVWESIKLSQPQKLHKEVLNSAKGGMKFLAKGSEMDTKAKIKEVFVNLLKVKPEELSDSVKLIDSIGIDSTEMVEAVIALEKVFSIKLSPKDITKFSTINDIEKNIQSKIKG